MKNRAEALNGEIRGPCRLGAVILTMKLVHTLSSLMPGLMVLANGPIPTMYSERSKDDWVFRQLTQPCD